MRALPLLELSARSKISILHMKLPMFCMGICLLAPSVLSGRHLGFPRAWKLGPEHQASYKMLEKPSTKETVCKVRQFLLRMFLSGTKNIFSLLKKDQYRMAVGSSIHIYPRVQETQISQSSESGDLFCTDKYPNQQEDW